MKRALLLLIAAVVALVTFGVGTAQADMPPGSIKTACNPTAEYQATPGPYQGVTAGCARWMRPTGVAREGKFSEYTAEYNLGGMALCAITQHAWDGPHYAYSVESPYAYTLFKYSGPIHFHASYVANPQWTYCYWSGVMQNWPTTWNGHQV